MSAPDVPGDPLAAAGLVRVVSGTVEEDELAALVAGIVAARAAAEAEQTDDGTRTSVWRDPTRRWGVPTRPSRGAWRWSTHRIW